MSVSITQQPQEYQPGYSPIWFTALSNNIAQTNFNYTVVCTDLISNDTQTYQIPQRPDGYCVFDAMPFAKTRLNHYCPLNEYGWKLATGVRKIRVNIGETYGSGMVYASGANTDFHVWNAILDYKYFPSYTQSAFIYDASASGQNVYLTDLLDAKTFEDRSLFLYALCDVNTALYSIGVKGYNSSGVLIKDSTILNPYSGSSNYREGYVCIDVGHKGLSNIDAGDVGGDYPIITDEVAYYDIYDHYNTGSEILIRLLKRVYIECEHRYDVYTIHYLRKNGSFNTLNFSKRSDTAINTQRNYYSKIPYELTAGVYEYSPSEAVERVLSTLSKETLKLNTDWLDDSHVELHKELIDAPVIYIDLGETDYLQLKAVTGSYKINKRYNERMFSLEMDFEMAHTNTRQDV